MFVSMRVLALIHPGTVTMTRAGLACVMCLQHFPFAIVCVPIDYVHVKSL